MRDTKVSLRRVLRIANKRLPIFSERKLRENLDMAGADVYEAYCMGVEEAQSVIIGRLAALHIPEVQAASQQQEKGRA